MKKKIAIFPAGSEIGLEINDALKYSQLFDIYGFTSIRDHSYLVYGNYVEGLPFYTETSFIEIMNKKINTLKIDLIYPANEDIQIFLVENSSCLNAQVISADLKTLKICRSKKATYDYFKNFDFAPKVYKSVEDVDFFPVITKPIIGRGQQGVRKVENYKELNTILSSSDDNIICEYLPGEEFCVDCFTDFNGTLQVCKLRNRKRIKNGVSFYSETLPMNETILHIADSINTKLCLNGAWFFQLKKNREDIYKLLEIVPRISGLMGTSRNTGVNYALLSVYNTMRMPICTAQNQYNIKADRAYIQRYVTDFKFDTVYLDFDNTLIINKKVNSFLVALLYQFFNKRIIVKLITNKKEIGQVLDNYRICRNIFDEVLYFNDKMDCKMENNSILISSSPELRAHFSTKGIFSFDCSETEALFDWKI